MHVPEITTLAQQDPELAQLIEGEAQRQHDTLRMIASENYVSRAVLEATGTVLTSGQLHNAAGQVAAGTVRVYAWPLHDKAMTLPLVGQASTARLVATRRAGIVLLDATRLHDESEAV